MATIADLNNALADLDNAADALIAAHKVVSEPDMTSPVAAITAVTAKLAACIPTTTEPTPEPTPAPAPTEAP